MAIFQELSTIASGPGRIEKRGSARLPRGYGFFAEFRCLQEMFKLFINVSQNDFLSFGLFYWYFILTFTRFWVIMILLPKMYPYGAGCHMVIVSWAPVLVLGRRAKTISPGPDDCELTDGHTLLIFMRFADEGNCSLLDCFLLQLRFYEKLCCISSRFFFFRWLTRDLVATDLLTGLANRTRWTMPRMTYSAAGRHE